MIPVKADARERRARREANAVRRAISGLILASLVAFTVVATSAVFVAHSIARKNALAEAERSARTICNVVFIPALPRVLAGDATALARLDAAVRIRSKDGSIVRVKVWRRDGTVIYSDDHAIIGAHFELRADVISTIDQQRTAVGLSDLTDPENVSETGQYRRLVEIYLPMKLDSGVPFAFEMYSTDARVLTAERDLTAALVPFALLALLVLVVTQLPVAVWLLRRVGRAQEERSRLLASGLAASARERRTIARDLHDGVVQDLSGAGYALGSLQKRIPAGAAPAFSETLEKVSNAVREAVTSVRTLIVDIYPRDLTAEGLRVALEDLAGPLRAAGTQIDVTIDLPVEPSPEVAASLYRCAREGLVNVAKHAGAEHVTLELSERDGMAILRIVDDGGGLPAVGIDRRHEGHLGLQLLRDMATDLGGELTVVSGQRKGAVLTMALPLGGIGHM